MNDNHYILRTQIVDGTPRSAIILPVAIHDVLYRIDKNQIISETVTGIDILIRLNHTPENLINLGERFFLTHMEAEEYLQRHNDFSDTNT